MTLNIALEYIVSILSGLGRRMHYCFFTSKLQIWGEKEFNEQLVTFIFIWPSSVNSTDWVFFILHRVTCGSVLGVHLSVCLCECVCVRRLHSTKHSSIPILSNTFRSFLKVVDEH